MVREQKQSKIELQLIDYMSSKKTYGLIGKNIAYSFSRQYFTEKFKNENLEGFTYENFDMQNLKELENCLKKNTQIKGLNVTIPFKENIIPFLDKMSTKATRIGAVNTIKITKKGKLKGYNTDAFGFQKSIEPLLQKHHKKALILGTGGASKAIAYALKKMQIKYQFVSRGKSKKYNYDSITPTIIEKHQIIINCTPLGTYPNLDECPKIPYQAITKNHILYDLVYNPKETLFLKKGKEMNAQIINGEKMLKLQAEKSWEIWNK